MKKSVYIVLSMLWIIVMSGCEKNQSMPSLDKESKMLSIESRASIGGLRSLDVSAAPSDTWDKPDKRSLSIDWQSDTWNNSDNKPALLISVGDEVYEVPASNYDYKRNGNSSSIKISYDIRYKSGDSEVRFYICDKSFYNKETKTLTFKNQNGTELVPLNSGGKKGFNFIFTAVMSIENLKAKRPINFVPLGTVVLFEKAKEFWAGNRITIKSDCFDFASDVDLKTGVSKTMSGAVSSDFTLKSRTTDDDIFGIYCINRNVEDGEIVISDEEGNPTTYNSIDFASLSGRFTNLRKLPRDKDWFAFECYFYDERNPDYHPINIYTSDSEELLNVIVRYREVGSKEWKYVSGLDAPMDGGFGFGGTLPVEVGCREFLGYNSFDLYGADFESRKNLEMNFYGMRNFGFLGDKYEKFDIKQWGTTKWIGVDAGEGYPYPAMGPFVGFPNLSIKAKDTPDFSITHTTANMFLKTTFSFIDDSFQHWDLSNVKCMNEMFKDCKNLNKDISRWDVNNVTKWDDIFKNCDISEEYKPAKFR